MTEIGVGYRFAHLTDAGLKARRARLCAPSTLAPQSGIAVRTAAAKVGALCKLLRKIRNVRCHKDRR
jgi:hypothetical protein